MVISGWDRELRSWEFSSDFGFGASNAGIGPAAHSTPIKSNDSGFFNQDSFDLSGIRNAIPFDDGIRLNSANNSFQYFYTNEAADYGQLNTAFTEEEDKDKDDEQNKKNEPNK